MLVLQVIKTPATITASEAIDITDDNHIAVATTKGVLCYRLVPNANFAPSRLNLERSRLPHKDQANPYFDQLGCSPAGKTLITG